VPENEFFMGEMKITTKLKLVCYIIKTKIYKIKIYYIYPLNQTY